MTLNVELYFIHSRLKEIMYMSNVTIYTRTRKWLNTCGKDAMAETTQARHSIILLRLPASFSDNGCIIAKYLREIR